MRKTCLFLFLLFAEPVTAKMIINEIMYNPAGSDNNLEFIEVCSNKTINLLGYVVSDLKSNDTLSLLKYENSNFALIVEDGFNHSGINVSVYSAGATIGDNLNNDYDEIFLYDGNLTLVAHTSYNNSMADGNGKSLELFNGSWFESIEYGGSPGRNNSAVLSAEMNSTNSTGNTTNQTGTVNSTVSNSCNVSMNILTEKEIYEEGETIKYLFVLSNSSVPFIIEYWIEDLAGSIVKSKYNTTNLNQKSWTPSIDESDRTFIIKGVLHLECNNNSAENSALRIVTVRSNRTNSPNSSINIEEVYTGSDGSIKFGESLRVRLLIYKGDSSKSVVEAWLEDGSSTKISSVSKSTLYDKFTEYELTVPIQLNPNCDGKFPDGMYSLVVAGLDVEEQAKVRIEGNTVSFCVISMSSSDGGGGGGAAAPYSYIPKEDYRIIEYPLEIEIGSEAITKVSISNPSYDSHNFTVWSYIYRGSKCYSGKREENMQTVHLAPDGSEILELRNIVFDVEPGVYKLKVKIKKDSLKTEYELTENVTVVPGYEVTKETDEEISKDSKPDLNNDWQQNSTYPGQGSKVVYESKTSKIRNAIIYFVLGLFVVVICVLVWRN